MLRLCFVCVACALGPNTRAHAGRTRLCMYRQCAFIGKPLMREKGYIAHTKHNHQIPHNIRIHSRKTRDDAQPDTHTQMVRFVFGVRREYAAVFVYVWYMVHFSRGGESYARKRIKEALLYAGHV